MDKSLRNVIVAGGVVLSLLGGLAGVGSAYADADVEAARNRLRTTMGKVTQGQNPNVGDNRQQPEVPELEGIKHRVPDVRDYGNAKIKADPMSIAQKYRPASQEARQAAEKADLLVFVSFSMPEASLKRIAHETAKAGGVMVIRGFKDDSLKATVKAAEELAALQGDMLIHPELFDHYDITEVPVTVIARNGEDGLDGCAVNSELGMCTEHAAVKGDVSLHAALEHLIRESKDKKLSDIANAKLAVLEGRK